MTFEELDEKCNAVVEMAKTLASEVFKNDADTFSGGFMHAKNETLEPIEKQMFGLYLFPNGDANDPNRKFFFCHGPVIHSFTIRELAILAVAFLYGGKVEQSLIKGGEPMKLFKLEIGNTVAYAAAETIEEMHERKAEVDHTFAFLPVDISEVIIPGYEINVSAVVPDDAESEEHSEEHADEAASESEEEAPKARRRKAAT